MDNIQKKLFALACDLQKVGRARIAAAVVYRKRIIGMATNSYCSHPEQKRLSGRDDKICLHAEVAAILKARKAVSESKLKYCTIYVVRAKYENKQMVPACAKPCAICQTLIDEFELKVKHT